MITYDNPIKGLAVDFSSVGFALLVTLLRPSRRLTTPFSFLPIGYEIVKILRSSKADSKERFETENLRKNILGVLNNITMFYQMYQSMNIDRPKIFLKSIFYGILMCSTFNLGVNGKDLLYSSRNVITKIVILIIGMIAYVGREIVNDGAIQDIQPITVKKTIRSSILNGLQICVLLQFVQQLIIQPKTLVYFSRSKNIIAPLAFHVAFMMGYHYHNKIIGQIVMLTLFVLIVLSILDLTGAALDIMTAGLAAHTLGYTITNVVWFMKSASTSSRAISFFTNVIGTIFITLFNQSAIFGTAIPITPIFYDRKIELVMCYFLIISSELFKVSENATLPMTRSEVVVLCCLYSVALFYKYESQESSVPEKIRNSSFSIFCMNIRQGYDMYGTDNIDRLIKLVKDESATILCFQEANAMSSMSKFRDVMGIIGEETGYHINQEAHFDEELYFKEMVFPMSGSIVKPKQHSIVMLEQNIEIMKRFCEKTVYRIGERNVHVWNLQLSDNETDRELQFNQVMEWTEKITDPLIVCGDFNVNILADKKEIIEGYGLAICDAGLQPYPVTFKDFDGEKRLDFILYTPDSLSPRNFNIQDTDVSDHFPITVDFDFV